jgi:hypothetical protein
MSGDIIEEKSGRFRNNMYISKQLVYNDLDVKHQLLKYANNEEVITSALIHSITASCSLSFSSSI